MKNEFMQRRVTTQEIRCEKCGEMFTMQTECENGYCVSDGEYYRSVCVDNVYYVYDKMLCPQCRKETDSNIIELLTEFGFKKY